MWNRVWEAMWKRVWEAIWERERGERVLEAGECRRQWEKELEGEWEAVNKHIVTTLRTTKYVNLHGSLVTHNIRNYIPLTHKKCHIFS